MKMRKAVCQNKCGFEEEFEPDEFGLSYFQAVGVCPNCNAITVYGDGKPTKEVKIFLINDEEDNEESKSNNP